MTERSTIEAARSSLPQGKIRRTLGGLHIWALGVGIVLVGDFMGWNLGVAQGGSTAAIIALLIMGVMYVGQILMVSEMSMSLPISGGQYEIAKHILGPLAGFNVGLMQVFEYVMLEAGDIIVIGQLIQILIPGINVIAVSILALLILTFINYRGAEGALKLNFIVTAVAFVCIIILLFSTNFYNPETTLINLKEMTNGLPYGALGLCAAIGYGCWFYLGIEGTVVAAGETRTPERAIPVGSFIGLCTLMAGGAITWYICSGLIDAETLGSSVYPLYEAAMATGKLFVIVAMFVATIFACLASANGCINDSHHVWACLSKDGMLPSLFAKQHPKYGTHYRSLLLMSPIALVFALTGMLDQVVTFSIFSALMVYLITCTMMVRFRKMYPTGSIKRNFKAPLFPALPIITAGIVVLGIFGLHLNYSISLIAAAIFYLLASVWFVMRRKKCIDNESMIGEALDLWGKPQQY